MKGKPRQINDTNYSPDQKPSNDELALQRTDVLNFGLLIMLKQCVFFFCLSKPKTLVNLRDLTRCLSVLKLAVNISRHVELA